MKRTLSLVLSLALTFALLGSTAALAASEVDTAAAYLVEHGIFVGDENGNLNLDQSLTRAELAVILTRLDYLSTPGGLEEWIDWGKEHFSDPQRRCNTFTDLPTWVLPFIEYCYQRGLMVGVGDNRFDPQGKVNPQMAATVMLRFCGIRETDWNYQTSVEKARNIGIAPSDGMDGARVLRGTMAVMIYRGIQYTETGTVPDEPVKPAPDTTSPPQVTPPASETSAQTLNEMKAEIVRLTNEARAEAGLSPLEVLPELMQCAQDKAQDMVDNHYYGHNSPKYGAAEDMIFSYIPNAATAAENIAAWNATPEAAFQSWMDSTKGHREIILTARLTHIGVGIVEGADGGYWWVQHFVKI